MTDLARVEELEERVDRVVDNWTAAERRAQTAEGRLTAICGIHFNDRGRCFYCGVSFPCKTAQIAAGTVAS